MKKNILLWTLYFAICGVVIGAAINAGTRDDQRYECRHTFTFTNTPALANK
jgi:hypothetical protein